MDTTTPLASVVLAMVVMSGPSGPSKVTTVLQICGLDLIGPEFVQSPYLHIFRA